jgi:tetratricopeptide (TPR) repeat protein
VEIVYAGDLNRAEILLEYWRAAGEPAKELDYLLVVARQRIELGINSQDVQDLLLRGLELSQTLPDAKNRQIALLKRLGDILFRQGDYAAASHQYERSRQLAEAQSDLLGQASALHGLGMIAWREGNLQQAEQHFLVGLAAAQNQNDQDQLLSSLIMLGVLRSEQADPQAAYTYYQQSLALAKELGDEMAVILCLINLGSNAQNQSDYAAANAWLVDALSRARAMNAHRYIAHALSNLALVQQEDKQVVSLDYITQALKIDHEINDRYALAYDLVTCGKIQLKVGTIAAARRSLREGLQVAQELGGQPNILLALLCFARLALKTGQAEQAAALCGLVAVQPGLTPELRQHELDPVLAELATVLPTEALVAAQERGRDWALQTTITLLAQQTD